MCLEGQVVEVVQCQVVSVEEVVVDEGLEDCGGHDADFCLGR